MGGSLKTILAGKKLMTKKRKRPSKSVDDVTHMPLRLNWSLEKVIVRRHGEILCSWAQIFHASVMFCVFPAEDFI